jgi:uncharacterized protein
MEEQPPFQRPDRKVLTVWLVGSLLGYGVLSAFFAVPGLVFLAIGKPKLFLFSLALAPLLIWVLTAMFLRRQWERWGYRVTPRTLEIRKGLVWQGIRVVARNRIQHIDINSGPLDRKFGLVQVVVYTAGTVVGMIPGLTPADAEALRAELSISMEKPKPPELA